MAGQEANSGSTSTATRRYQLHMDVNWLWDNRVATGRGWDCSDGGDGVRLEIIVVRKRERHSRGIHRR